MRKIRLSKKHIISTQELTKSDIIKIIETAHTFEIDYTSGKFSRLLKDNIIAIIFLEPSTRTRLSFEAAALRLGAQVITMADARSSSVTKGESLTDTMRIIEGYADCIVLRQSLKGGARMAAEVISIPLINGGDGTGEHPTQALLDLYTINKECGKLDNLTISLVGDLKNGRTVHSLSHALLHFNPNFIFCSPPELDMPRQIISRLNSNKIKIEQTGSLKKALQADIIYMTRIQQERFKIRHEYEKYKGHYILTKKLVEQVNPQIKILHPLPRVDEIARDVDDLANAAYFRQAHNGLFVRMALLALVLAKI